MHTPAMDRPTGSSIGGPSSHGTPSSNGAPAKPVLARRPPGGIKVSTVKRVAALPPSRPGLPSSPSSASSSPAPRFNGLSEEKRQRVEEIRRERERKRREEEERMRPAKASTQALGSNAASRGTAKRKKRAAQETDDEDELFSTGSDASAKRKKEGRKVVQHSTTGQGYKKLGRLGVLAHYLVPRALIDEDAFQTPPAEEVRPTQSAVLVQGKQYGPFFSNLTEEPRVSLEYPGIGCSEEFSLLVPKDRDEYDPISDLLRTVRCIVEFYLTPEQQALFGSLDSLETASAAGHLLNNASRAATSLPVSRENSVLGSEGTLPTAASNPLSPSTAGHTDSPREATPLMPAHIRLTSPLPPASLPDSPARSAILVSATTAASSPLFADSPASSSADKESILRSFTKARNRRDGQLFVRTVDRFNDALRSLKESGKVEENVRRMGERGVCEGIWRCLQEQCYARTVAPRVDELSKYEAFSDNVYGELLPRFMSEISQLTNLGPESVFVDLGSGVGNLLIQVALQTGSAAYGCEQMLVPSQLASLQVEEARRRWKMWGLAGGRLRAWQGDFGEDDEVRDVLRKADVVLVNNYAFTARTNDKLSLQFLDLKDGAQIVSLKPFVPADFRLTERTLSSPLAILRVAQRNYTSGCVSWADGGGRYYIHTVDRSMIAAFLDERAQGSLGRGDVGKRQWHPTAEASDGEQA